MPTPAQRTYDQLAPVYDRRWDAYTGSTLRATLDGLGLRDDGRVLDLAAGTGELARRLLARQPDLSLVGLDVSRVMLRQRLGKRPFVAVQGDAARLPLAGGSFDAVICANAFHLFPKPEVVLTEVRRVLRPGGTLTLTDWCDDYLICKLCSAYLRLVDRSFYRTYTLRECRRMLASAGFEVVSARKFKIDWLWGLMRLECR